MKKKYNIQEKISLPLIGVYFTPSDNGEKETQERGYSHIKFNHNHSKMAIGLREFQVIGDMDLLSSLQESINRQDIEDMIEDSSQVMVKMESR